MQFNQKAHAYDQWAHVQKDSVAWYSEWLEDDLTGKHALEVGAGTGLFTRDLVNRGATIQAVDNAPQMVTVGRMHIPNAHWHLLDARALHFRQMDRLYSSNLLQWMPHPRCLLQQWARILRPGGKLLCGYYIAPTLHSFYSLTPGLSPIKWRNEDQWARIWSHIPSLSLIRLETKTLTYHYPSLLSLLRALHGTGATHPNRFEYKALKELIMTHKNAPISCQWTLLRIEAERR